MNNTQFRIAYFTFTVFIIVYSNIFSQTTRYIKTTDLIEYRVDSDLFYTSLNKGYNQKDSVRIEYFRNKVIVQLYPEGRFNKTNLFVLDTLNKSGFIANRDFLLNGNHWVIEFDNFFIFLFDSYHDDLNIYKCGFFVIDPNADSCKTITFENERIYGFKVNDNKLVIENRFMEKQFNIFKILLFFEIRNHQHLFENEILGNKVYYFNSMFEIISTEIKRKEKK